MTKTVNIFFSSFFRAAFKIYSKLPPFSLKKRAWRWMRRKMHYRKFLIPYGHGGKILVDERDFVQREIFLKGAYEREVWETFSAHIQPGDVVWDIGANVGSFAIRALLDPRVKSVHAFEPEPNNLEQLTVNLSLNRGHYVIHPKALSDQKETLQIYGSIPGNCGEASFNPKEAAAVITKVDCETADDLVFHEGVEAPSLVKIDVEGWELKVLKGASRLLREKPPRAIVFEARYDKETGTSRDPELMDYLKAAGYQVRHIQREYGKIDIVENYLAVFEKSVNPMDAS